MFFVKLQLKQSNTILSDNFYWSPAQGSDCTALRTLPQVSLRAAAHSAAEVGAHKITVDISNPAYSIDLAVRLKIVRGKSNDRVLPTMYEDNYFSLLPKESKTLQVRFPNSALVGESPRLIVTGWNVREESHNL